MSMRNAPPAPFQPHHLCGRTMYVLRTGRACWVVDPSGRRFVRVSGDAQLESAVLFSDWNSYERLLVDGDGTVTLVLDRTGCHALHLPAEMLGRRFPSEIGPGRRPGRQPAAVSTAIDRGPAPV
jgi:hypothetical protein